MKRELKGFSRWTVILPVFLVLVFIGSYAQKVEIREQPLPRPAWLKADPLIIVGNWDSMPIFRRRVGGNPAWQEDDYLKEHTEETVKKLKDMDVTMAVIHFYKGFGLEAEKEHLEDAKKLASLCKKYGIKVGVYVGSTVAYETFLLEKPEGEEWFVPDYLGRPVFYSGTQTFRKRVYFMHPGYTDYIKRVLRIAIEDLKVDLVHFDNTSQRAQAPTFFHPLGVQHFRDFLRNKYVPERLKKRLGFSDVTYVVPPKYDAPLSTIDDPLFQEWTDFRCQQLTSYYGEMARFIRSLNPEVAVECNPHSGLSGVNTMWVQGVDYPRLLSHTDIVWTEEGNEATVTEDEILVSKIRTYKMASTLRNKIFTYTSGSKLQMAEAMAYNRQCLGMVGGVLAGYELPEGQREYIKFYTKNFEHYRDVDNVADVAVLRSFSTMAFHNDRPYQSTYLFEQALIQAKVPFDIIFDENLRHLSKYRVLVLADQECLSDEQLDLVRNFVKEGGGLVATEHTSLYTEWRQRRRDFGFKDLFKLETPPFQPWPRRPEKVLNMAPVRSHIERGRVVYIPEIQPSVEKPPAVPMNSKYWKLALNWKELIESVKWAAGGSLSIEVKAPVAVTAELIEQKERGKLIVHLINYDVERTPLVKNIEISLKIPYGKKVEQVTVLSPDEGKIQSLTYTVKNKGIVFTVPRLETYSLVAIKLNMG